MSFTNILSFLGGVGLFLYGMTVMSSGLRNAAGDKLRTILEKVAGNRVLAIFIGILVTMLIQSSSATDMMVIGFVDSALMSLQQAMGVIMGANIGTTITAQITAFNLVAFAPFILFVGCILSVFVKKAILRHIGNIILGFGMLFVGIGILKAAIAPLSASPEFIQVLSVLSHPLLGIGFGFLFTSLLQSSSSSIVIFQACAVEGLLNYEQCVFLAIGAAVGSVTPNLLASLTTGRNGKRTALLNLYFNLLRAALLTAIVLIFPAVTEWIQNLSPGDVARQVANTHTIFAIFAVLVLSPFASLIVRGAEKTLPLQAAEQQALEDRRLKYLSNVSVRSIPAVAMRQASLEVVRMGRIARDNLEMALQYFFEPSRSALFEKVEQTEETVDYLNKVIEDKLVELRALQLSDRDVFRLSRMVLVVSNFERISDYAENIIEFADRLKNAKVSFSEDAEKELRTMSTDALKVLDLSIQIFEEERFDLLPEAEALEQGVDDMEEHFIQNHVERLMQGKCDPLGGVIFADMCTNLERCSDQAINIATALMHQEV
ncbi:MAG: Na/Pi cotransporter family protein [Lachnospiraceae bacterium]|nr:Na/Pi cotransporter family protein [Lachnospiraceae bacterium]